MAREGQTAHGPALTPHHPHVHHHFPPFHHHSHGAHYHHHHHQPPPPPPFLCARCKCWNFPANPHLNPSPYSHPFPYPAVCGQAQELPPPSIHLQAQENPSANRFDEEEDEEEGYDLVMTDEWAEFFAKSEARRQEKKRQQKKAARGMRKTTKARSEAHEPSAAE